MWMVMTARVRSKGTLESAQVVAASVPDPSADICKSHRRSNRRRIARARFFASAGAAEDDTISSILISAGFGSMPTVVSSQRRALVRRGSLLGFVAIGFGAAAQAAVVRLNLLVDACGPGLPAARAIR